MTETPPTDEKGQPSRDPRRGGWIATVIIVVGAAWTLLTGACTGVMSVPTSGIALIFGLPLVLGGGAVWTAGRLLRGDPTDHKVRSRARALAMVAAIGSVVAVGFAIWIVSPPNVTYGLGELFAMFAGAGVIGGLVLLAIALKVWLARPPGADG
jgi:hypothetical protein